MVKLARVLRRKQTDAEIKLWRVLRNGQLNSIKFRRQEPIGGYIVDFVTYEHKMIIEIDGGQHKKAENIEQDGQRTLWLKNQGFSILRFWDNDVLLNTDGVYHKILANLDLISPSPVSSPIQGEEERPK